MKKIINDKLYDTETASAQADYQNHHMPRDFKYVEEKLYIKMIGEYFLYGSGGPPAQYAELHGNGACPGEAIIPFTPEQAREWAETHAIAEEYIEIIGEVEE